MKKLLLGVGLSAAIGATSLLTGMAAYAASPSPTSSCVAQLNQGATPHGLSQSPPGLLGQFVSSEASSAPGVVGSGSSTFAHVHGDLLACLPIGGI